MSAHLSDSAIYGHLWGTDETRAMLCDEGRLGSTCSPASLRHRPRWAWYPRMQPGQ